VDEEKKPVNIRLTNDLWHKVKVQAAIESKTITQWITDVLQKVLENK
jgi:hypothetical protein